MVNSAPRQVKPSRKGQHDVQVIIREIQKSEFGSQKEKVVEMIFCYVMFVLKKGGKKGEVERKGRNS